MDIPSYVVDKSSISQARLLLALSVDTFEVSKKEEKWYALINKLPLGMRAALRAELILGNAVTSIQYSNWPQKGSVLVSLEKPFKSDFTSEEFGVKKRILNDAHYWNQDIYQTVDGVDYLIIC